jgi:DNA-binding response OmpR family regulator
VTRCKAFALHVSGTILGDSRTIDVHVRQLRRKLGDACPIQTVWGTGYKVPAKR